MQNLDFGKYYEAPEPGRRERAYGWATAIGLQDVDGLKPSQYLIDTARRNIVGEISADDARRLVDEYYEVITNDLFADKSYYFRNALVRANYENQALNVAKTQLPLEEFFKVLIYGDEIELHNRFLKIGQEYGTPAAKAIADLHRHDDAINVVVKQPDVVVNVVVKLSKTEESAIKALLRTPHHTASSLAATLEVSQRQAQRVIASLKKKVGLKRRGADKNGEWYFEGAAK